MQTEMMIRLLKDGKIVGYEWRAIRLQSERIAHIKNIDDVPAQDTWIDRTPLAYIRHDSIEPGIKVDGEWIFGEYKYDKNTKQYAFIESTIKNSYGKPSI